MAPKQLLLLAASVVAAQHAPASLVSNCAEPASAYAIRACAAERLNLAHGDPALRPLPEEESMRGIISAGGPRSACVECHSPSLNWVHLTHSMKQAFDVLRQLRACGLPVHAWP